jgi:hypothetical protein
MADKLLVPAERIEHAILVLRGQKVMLDSELAALYEVPVKALNRRSSAISTVSRRTSCSSLPTTRSAF